MTRAEMIEAMARAIKAKVPYGYGMTEPETVTYAEAALSAIEQAGLVVVPDAALKWLNGEGPDEAGHWFGDAPEDVPVGRRAFWWRSKFTLMVQSGRLK